MPLIKKNFTVQPKDTAAAMGSGDLEVLATPALIAMVENTAKESVQESLTVEETTVGIDIQLSHLAPTAVGKQVICEVTLVKQENSIQFFTFKAFVGDQLIAKGTHKRARVNKKDFLQKI